MRIRTLGIALLPFFFALTSVSRADTITREGSSYSGRGKQGRVPAETVLHFRLERPLVLQPQ